MKKFVDKLIESFLGECVIYAENYEKALNIANELAEEYKLLENIEQLNNGWIPCSERLPKDNTNVIVCFRTGTVKVLRYEDTGIFRGINEYTTMVIIAWMPLPAPYKEGVTENE